MNKNMVIFVVCFSLCCCYSNSNWITPTERPFRMATTKQVNWEKKNCLLGLSYTFTELEHTKTHRDKCFRSWFLMSDTIFSGDKKMLSLHQNLSLLLFCCYSISCSDSFACLFFLAFLLYVDTRISTNLRWHFILMCCSNNHWFSVCRTERW